MKTSPIQSTTKSQYSTAKKVIKTTVAAAAATGTVLYMAKTGKLNPTEGGNKTIEAIKAGLKKPADKILEKTVPFIKQIKKTASNKISSFQESHPRLDEIKGNVIKTISTLRDKIETKSNPEKFIV